MYTSDLEVWKRITMSLVRLYDRTAPKPLGRKNDRRKMAIQSTNLASLWIGTPNQPVLWSAD